MKRCLKAFLVVFALCLTSSATSVSVVADEVGANGQLNSAERKTAEKLLQQITDERQEKWEGWKFWREFQEIVRADFEAALKECGNNGMPSNMEIEFIANDEITAIRASVPRRDGVVRIETYRISRSSLYTDNHVATIEPTEPNYEAFNIETAIAVRSLKVFCRKVAEWQKEGLIVKTNEAEPAKIAKKATPKAN